MCQLRM